MSSKEERRDFIADVTPRDLLDQAIPWIKTNLNPCEVFDDDALIEWSHENGYHTDDEIAADKSPDEVFPTHKLRDWAEGAGYREEE